MTKILFKYFLLALIILVVQITYSQELLPANKNTFDSLKNANKGKVILFNFWATWCKPCVEEFPDLMKLNNEYRDKDFKLVFVSLDFSKDIENKTKTFLKKHEVDFVSYYNGFDNDEELINYMDKNWDGGIPGTFIFDKDGNLKKTFIGKRKYEDFKIAVEENFDTKYIKP